MSAPIDLTPPPTPHLAWLGRAKPHDKVLPAGVARAILARPVVIEELADGATIGLIADGDAIQVVRRQQRLDANAHPQFHAIWGWLAEREEHLVRALGPRLALFGAWCHATHAVQHDGLPDWFVLSDVVDRDTGKVWSADRRNALAKKLELAVAPEVARIKTDVADLTKRLDAESNLGLGPIAGLVVRLEQGDHLVERAVLVRAEVADAPEEPSVKKTLERNALA